jgi:FKBP-type peptidyl-prolyl cis-trans isomerase 2
VLLACSKAPRIEQASHVTLKYTLKVDGQVVDTSEGKDPLQLEVGSGQVIPGFEENIKGLKKGDKKSFTVSPEKGYGEPNPDLVQIVKKTEIQDGDKIQEGSVLTGQTPDGNVFQARVMKVEGAHVTLDLTSPMAGKTLNFDIEIVDVANKTPPPVPSTTQAPEPTAPETAPATVPDTKVLPAAK